MKKVAFITFAYLPLPATRGGAIEMLITNIIKENEKYEKLRITTYSIYDNHAEIIGQKLKFCNCKFIDYSSRYSRFYNLTGRLLRRISLKKIEYISYFMRKVTVNINKSNFDYIIVCGGGVLLPQLKKHIGTKIIMYFHSDPLSYLSDKQCKAIVDCTDKIFCVSNFISSQVLSVVPLAKTKIYTIYNCTDFKLLGIDECKKYRYEIRTKFNVTQNDKLLIYCGRIDPIKGIKELLLAFRQITQKNIKLLIIGSSWSGSNKKNKYGLELEKIAKSIENEIIFTGYISHDDLPKYYAAADISVVPSICNEAAPLTIIESITMGVPVITTKLGGIPEYCNDENAIIINYDENTFIDDLKNEIEKLLLDSDKCQSMVQKNKDYYRKHNTNVYYNLFTDVLIRRGG